MMPVVEHASANAMIVKLGVKGEVFWLKMGGFWKEVTCRKIYWYVYGCVFYCSDVCMIYLLLEY